jgi:hypothetical protein
VLALAVTLVAVIIRQHYHFLIDHEPTSLELGAPTMPSNRTVYVAATIASMALAAVSLFRADFTQPLVDFAAKIQHSKGQPVCQGGPEKAHHGWQTVPPYEGGHAVHAFIGVGPSETTLPLTKALKNPVRL